MVFCFPVDLEASEADMISRQGEQADFHSSIGALAVHLACARHWRSAGNTMADKAPAPMILSLVEETDDKAVMTIKFQL